MMRKKDIKQIINKLKEKYPEATCSLDFSNPFQMAISVLLSAQCTDKRVNIVTKDFFKVAPNSKEMAKLTIEDIEKYIQTCGLYKNKAKNIYKLTQKIESEYNGIIPEDIDKLMELPGIGRKSANVIMLEAFSNPQGVAIDTHAGRICNRIGISNNKDPNKIEQDLLKLLDKEDYYDANHLFVWHGRYTCKARKPECINCNIQKYCKYYNEEVNKNKNKNKK